MQAPVAGLRDVIVQPQYDTAVVVTGTQILNFFQNPVGQGVGAFGAAGAAKTYADTNLDLPGQLPAGYSFRIMGFRLAFPWNVILADAQTVLNGAVFSFIVGAKPFLTVPARTIPAGNGLFGQGGIAAAAAAVAPVLVNGWPSMQNAFAITTKSLDIKATENFKITLSWPGVTPTIAQTGFIPTPGLPLTTYLDGFLYRPVQ